MYLALNEFTDDLVVEVVNRSPFDPLLHILLLLCLQRQLNEDLLKLLIHKVDAELLKSIFLNETKVKSHTFSLISDTLFSSQSYFIPRLNRPTGVVSGSSYQRGLNC